MRILTQNKSITFGASREYEAVNNALLLVVFLAKLSEVAAEVTNAKMLICARTRRRTCTNLSYLAYCTPFAREGNKILIIAKVVLSMNPFKV